MSQWLITVDQRVSLERLAERLPADATILDRSFVPLGDGHKVCLVSGADDLDKRLTIDAEIVAVSPSSPLGYA